MCSDLKMRLTSSRWWGTSVGSIEPVGILYGLTTQAWIAIASPTATSTVAISPASDRARGLESSGMCATDDFGSWPGGSSGCALAAAYWPVQLRHELKGRRGTPAPSRPRPGEARPLQGSRATSRRQRPRELEPRVGVARTENESNEWLVQRRRSCPHRPAAPSHREAPPPPAHRLA